MSLGPILRQIRKSRDVRAKHLAEVAGITAPSLCHLESGKWSPADDTAARLLSALHDVSPLTDDEREAVKAARVVGILPGAA